MSDLTPIQRQRLEALREAATLLVDRESRTSGGSILSKGSDSMSATGLIGASGEAGSHLAAATLAATDLAEYVISGDRYDDGVDSKVVIDEHGIHLEGQA